MTGKKGGLLCIIYKYWYWQNTKWSPQLEIYAHGFMKGFRKFGLKARCMISRQGSSLLFRVRLYYHHHYLLSSSWNKHHKSSNSCYYKTAFILFYLYCLFHVESWILNYCSASGGWSYYEMPLKQKHTSNWRSGLMALCEFFAGNMLRLSCLSCLILSQPTRMSDCHRWIFCLHLSWLEVSMHGEDRA